MKLEGEIGEINVIEQLVGMGRERFTGAVRFENDGIIKIIYFKVGDVLSASTNDRADSIDEILLRAGKVNREHVKQALAKRKENETLGDALLNLGFITRKELTWARRAQVIGVIRSLEAWSAGQFTVVADYLPKREEGTLFPLPQIIIELIVTDQERQRYERSLSGGEVVFRKGPGFDDSFRGLGLNDDAEAIAAQIDGARSAAAIASASGKDTFNVYKLLQALSMLGLLERDDTVQVSHEVSAHAQDNLGFAGSGVADAADMWNDAPAVPPQEDPGLSLGLDFPSMPGPLQEAAVLPAPAALDAKLTWDVPAAADAIPKPAPAAVPPAAAASGPTKWDSPPYASPVMQPPKPQDQWGFDEAQIETSRRATTASQRATDRLPPSVRASAQKQKKTQPNRWLGMAIAAGVLILIALGGFAGWTWWQSRSEAPARAQVTPAAQRSKRPLPPLTTTAAPATAAETTGLPLTASATASPAANQIPVTTTMSVPAKRTPAPAPAATGKTAAAAPAPRPTSPVTTTPPPMAPARVEAAPVTGAHVERSATGATITNARSAFAAPGDATRAHFDEMARKFAAQATGNYTVQFELVCEASSLTTAVNVGGANVWFVPFAYHNRACYRVFWGRYATQNQASAAIRDVPAAIRGPKPVVVSVPKP